jgi:hypothetical protein
MHARFRLRIRLARCQGVVDCAQLIKQNAARKPVADRVMHCHGEHAVLGGEANQPGPQHRPGGQVEGLTDRFERQIVSLLLALSGIERGQVRNSQFEGRGRLHDLNRAVHSLDKFNLQRFVPAAQFVQAFFEQLGIDVSMNAENAMRVVNTGPRILLLQEPEHLLGIR